ncbi:MAG TPA: hypothetical protein VHV51_13820 [Polyangiaceae bacterium]|nr:hypothetical protein [Polyangiaceae bacterium]
MLLADSFRWVGVSGLFLAVNALSSSALAVESVPRATREYRVEFSADRVEVDGELGTLDLAGHVRVQAQRYLLKSPHLQLKRGARGVEVDGAAAVAFCACDDPPLQLHVHKALLAPPTDALFGSTTLLLGGVPIFWLPALWLRAPTRSALIFPRLAYRGADGFFVGDGVYFPLAVDDGRVVKSLTLDAGAYLVKGARIGAELDTEASTSRVAWDHVEHTALEIDAHGSAALSDANFAYRVDALRGARAPVESSSLEVAARRMDRARVAVSHVDEFALGFGVRADAPRAGALRDFGAAGPELYLGAAQALGDSATYDAFGTARTTVLSGNHSQTALGERATLNATARPGPLGVAFTAAQSSELQVGELRTDGTLRGGAQARIGLPLLRRFGTLAHFVEPVLIARGLVESSPRGSELHATSTALAAGGVDTSLGDHTVRQAASLSLRAGAIERLGENPSNAAFVSTAKAIADARWIGLAQSFALLGATPQMISLSRLRLGAADALHLLLHADGASNGSPAEARVLFDATWFDPAQPYLDRDGWSAGSELSVPWTRALTTTAALDYDLTARSLLAAWGGIGFRHPCGCLALSSFVGHRVGRPGVDAWLGFDLAP